MRPQLLIVPVFAAAALASGCASRDARYRGNDYQCGSARPTVIHDSAFAGRPPESGCGGNLETLAVARGMFESLPKTTQRIGDKSTISHLLPLARQPTSPSTSVGTRIIVGGATATPPTMIQVLTAGHQRI